MSNEQYTSADGETRCPAIQQLGEVIIAVTFGFEISRKKSGTAICNAVVCKVWDRCVDFQLYKHEGPVSQAADRWKVWW